MITTFRNTQFVVNVCLRFLTRAIFLCPDTKKRFVALSLGLISRSGSYYHPHPISPGKLQRGSSSKQIPPLSSSDITHTCVWRRRCARWLQMGALALQMAAEPTRHLLGLITRVAATLASAARSPHTSWPSLSSVFTFQVRDRRHTHTHAHVHAQSLSRLGFLSCALTVPNGVSAEGDSFSASFKASLSNTDIQPKTLSSASSRGGSGPV